MRKSIILVALVSLLTGACCSNGSEKTIEKFNQIAKDVKKAYAPDSRDETFNVNIEKDEDGELNINGYTTLPAAKDSLLQALKANNIDADIDIEIIPDAEELEGKVYAVAAQSVINFRNEGDYAAEAATQCLMGAPLKVLMNEDGWTLAVTPEGYHAWVSSSTIARMTAEEFAKYTAADKVVLTVKYADIKEAPDASSQQVCDAVWGNVMLDLGRQGNWWKVGIADGREGYLPASVLVTFPDWVASRKPTPENIIATAKTMIGVPYMWAATSVKAMDCSGFTKNVYYLNGIVLRRDASQQCKTGDDIDVSKYSVDSVYTREALANLQMGDLIFFGRNRDRISHVGMYIGDGIFIHEAGKVHISSLIPEDENYYTGSKRLQRACRIIGNVDCGKNIWSVNELYTKNPAIWGE